MVAAPAPKFVRSLALDFPDICLQFSWEIIVGKNAKKLHTTLYIFTRLFNLQDGLRNSDLL